MTTMWQTGTITVGDLIESIKNSTLGLPQFQRLAVWGRKDWVPFLTTLLRGRPTGTLLLLEAGVDDKEFAPRPIEGGPALGAKPLKWLLLDGQQRTTTIFRAFQDGFGDPGRPKKEFVLDVKAALSRGELLETDLELVNSGRVPGNAALAAQGKVAVKALLDEGLRLAWLNSYVDAHAKGEPDALQQYVATIKEVIPGLSSVADYKFPILEVKNSAPLEVVVDIFEGMNRRGMRLDQFDLMVARLYKLDDNGYFDLRKKYDELLASSPKLQLLGVDEDDGMLPLQLIAMQYTRLPAVLQGKVKGLNKKDVLELPAEQIIGSSAYPPPYPDLDLDKAMAALESAADFLVSHCGVRCPKLLPQKSMLLPLGDQFLLPTGSRLSNEKLKKWFFAVGITGDYYGSVNSYADRDCKELYEWATDPSANPPQAIINLNRDAVNALDLTQAMTREAAIPGTAIMALLVANGAKDWALGQLQVQASPQDVDFHHMVPENKLKSLIPNKADRIPIANFTPIFSATNRSLGDTDPGTVLTSLGKEAAPILASHHVSKDLLVTAGSNRTNFDAHLKDREGRLKRFVIEALGL